MSLGGGGGLRVQALTLPRESPTWLPREATPCLSEWPLVAPPAGSSLDFLGFQSSALLSW